MSFMLINGIVMPVDMSTYDEKFREIGAIGEVFGGAGNKCTWAAPKLDIGFETTPLLDSDAYSWVQLLRGIGERWSFTTVDNLGATVNTMYGSKGTGPTSTSGLTVTTGGIFGKKLTIASGSSFTIPFTSTKWTVSAFWGQNGGGQSSFIVTSAGHKWNNGARNDALGTTWLTNIAGTSITVGTIGGLSTELDEFILLPFEVPDTWGTSFWSMFFDYVSPYPATPQLMVFGDVFGTFSGSYSTKARFYMGNVVGIKTIRVPGSASLRRKLAVTLTEV